MYVFLRRQKVISLRLRSLLQFFVYGKSVRPARDSRTAEQSHKKNRFRIVLPIPVFENFIGGNGVVAVIPEKDFVAYKMISCGNSFPYRQNRPRPSGYNQFLYFPLFVILKCRTSEKFFKLLYTLHCAATAYKEKFRALPREKSKNRNFSHLSFSILYASPRGNLFLSNAFFFHRGHRTAIP